MSTVLGVSHDCIAVVTPTGGLLLRARLNCARVAGMILLDVPAVRAQLISLHVASALLERPVPAGSSIEAYERGALFGNTVGVLKALGIATRTEMPARWRDALNIRGDVVAAANRLFATHDFALADDAIAALLALYGSRLSPVTRSVGAASTTSARANVRTSAAPALLTSGAPPARFGGADFFTGVNHG